MRILFVEDNDQDIEGLLYQCKGRHWDTEVTRSFCGATPLLSDPEKHYDVIVVDIMLPWGSGAPPGVRRMFSDENAGLFLLETMRATGIGIKVAQTFKIKPLTQWKDTPVIVLSKIGAVRVRCLELNIVGFFDKLDYGYRDMVAALERLEMVNI